MNFPTPWTVDVREPVFGEEDTHGNAEIIDWTAWAAHAVYGWAPAGTAEPFEINRSAVTYDLDLYVPPAFSCSPQAQIRCAGGDYEVEGKLEDFNHGPFGFAPGGRLRLRRVDG